MWVYVLNIYDISMLTEKRVKDIYQALMRINADAILSTLLSRDVITFDEKGMFATKALQREKMQYLIDDIIVPSLEVGLMEKFKNFLEVLESSDDITINAIGKQIGMVNLFAI